METNTQKKPLRISFILFEDYHQRKDIGSSRIRGQWWIEKIKGAERFVQGKDYDVVVYQKVYWKEHARAFKGLKILDLCDPDWLVGAEVLSFIQDIDVITVSTLELKNALEKMTDKPVYFIPDGVKFEGLPKPKKHEGRAKSCVWFGYSQNIDVLEQTYFKIKKEDLLLKIISENGVNLGECRNEFIKWDIETVNQEIQKADFALLPKMNKGRYIYKSDNKVWQSWALGMPVVQNEKDFDRFLIGEERQKESEKRYKEVKENYSVDKSVEILLSIIEKHYVSKKRNS